jgi:uncharacterized protein
VRVRLNAVAHAFPPDHCLRVAVSPTYWPFAWPSPEPVTLTLFAGSLRLPVRPPRGEDEELPPFAEPEASEPLAVEALAAGGGGRAIRRGVGTGVVDLVVDLDFFPSLRLLENGLEYAERGRDEFRIVEGDPLSAHARSTWTIELGRGEWRTRVETSSVLTADAESFRVTNVLDAYEGNARVFSKTWAKGMRRDLL